MALKAGYSGGEVNFQFLKITLARLPEATHGISSVTEWPDILKVFKDKFTLNT